MLPILDFVVHTVLNYCIVPNKKQTSTNCTNFRFMQHNLNF